MANGQKSGTGKDSVAAGIPEKWDKEVDVVILGTGTVNAAALAAHEAGNKVLILEKAATFGGTTILSGGGAWIPNNHVMKKEGLPDSREEVLTYLKRVIPPARFDAQMVEAFVDNCNKMIEFVMSCGVGPWEFLDPYHRPMVPPESGQTGQTWVTASGSGKGLVSPAPSQAATQAGGAVDPERAAMMAKALATVASGLPGTVYADYFPSSLPGHKSRGRSLQVTWGNKSGDALGTLYRKALEKRGIEVMLGTPGKRLIYRGDSSVGDGEVVGVVAESDGREIAIKARKGVIVGTGSFDHNPEMIEHFLRAPLYATNTVPTNTGDGHLMCMAVGADLRNMNEVWKSDVFALVPGTKAAKFTSGDMASAPAMLRRGFPGSISVNRLGRRVGNEAASYAILPRVFQEYDTGTMEWMNIPLFTIWDGGYVERYGVPGAGPDGKVPVWLTVADSLDELAEEMGIDPTGLAATVERFNHHAKQGVDPDYHRGESSFDRQTSGDTSLPDNAFRCLGPLVKGPYYATTMWPSAMGGTCGGPRTNDKAQVVNVWGKVIPRLYCTGNAMANVFRGEYPGGGSTVGSGMTFAYIAGNHAATLSPWE